MLGTGGSASKLGQSLLAATDCLRRLRCFLLILAPLLPCAPQVRAELSEPTLPGISDRLARLVPDFLETLARTGRYDEDELATAATGWEQIQGFAAKGLAAPTESNLAAQDFVRDTLASLEPDYGRALAAMDVGQAEIAADIFTTILKEDSPYSTLQSYCTLGLGQALFALGRYNEARVKLASALEAGSPYLAHMAEALSDLARALEAIGLRSAAEATNQRILDEFAAEAPEDVLSWAKIKARKPRAAPGGAGGGMTEVVGLMGKSEGRLREEDTGAETQVVQEKILSLLDELIKQAEEQEKGGGGGGGGGSKPGPGGPASGQKASSPASSSALPGGDGAPKNLRRVSEGDQEQSWGSLPEREREKIIQSLKERFPSRYQELLEQYFKDIQADGK